MDIETLAGQVAPYVTAVVDAYGAAVLTRLEDVAADETVHIGQSLLRTILGSRSQPGVVNAVQELSTAVNDSDLEEALLVQIRRALRQDEALAARITAILPQATVSTSGDYSPAVGHATGPVAVGDRAMAFQNSMLNAPKRGDVINADVVHQHRRRFFFLPFGFIFRTTKTVGASAGGHPVAAGAAALTLAAGVATAGLLIARPSGSTDPLSGYWRDGSGNTVQLTAAGQDTWTGQIVQGTAKVCLPANITLTGTDGHYRGTEAFHVEALMPSGECGPYAGTAPMSLALEPGGGKADFTLGGQPVGGATCSNCGGSVWVKQAGPPAAVPPVPGSPAGLWQGTYTCAQGLTGITMLIADGENGSLNAIWDFYAVSSNPGVPTGAVALTGSHSGSQVSLTPNRWIYQPAGYGAGPLTMTIGADGNTLSGPVRLAGCTTLALSRVGTSARATDSLPGQWRTANGTVISFTPGATPGTYTGSANATTACRLPGDIAVTGSAGHYIGAMDTYASCDRVRNTAPLTIDISPDGATAKVAGAACADCGSGLWTKTSPAIPVQAEAGAGTPSTGAPSPSDMTGSSATSPATVSSPSGSLS